MQAQRWCVEWRNRSQHSWYFCFHRQCNRGCPSLVSVLSSWYNGCWNLGAISRQLIYLRITVIVSKSSYFQAHFSSLPAQTVSSPLISQNLYSQTLGIGAGKEINKERISDYPGCFLCFGRINFIVITYVLKSTHNKRVSKRQKKIQKWLEESRLQSSDYHKQQINHILGSCKHPKLVFCFCYRSNGKSEQQDVCSQCTLVISHGDCSRLLVKNNLSPRQNLIALIKKGKQ